MFFFPPPPFPRLMARTSLPHEGCSHRRLGCDRGDSACNSLYHIYECSIGHRRGSHECMGCRRDDGRCHHPRGVLYVRLRSACLACGGCTTSIHRALPCFASVFRSCHSWNEGVVFTMTAVFAFVCEMERVRPARVPLMRPLTHIRWCAGS